MGQKEIFMVILVLIIVVLSVVIAMLVIKEETLVLSEDEMESVMVSTGTNLQAWYTKPAGLGGGGKNWAKANFDQVPCSFGSPVSTRTNMGCMTDDHKMMIMMTPDTDYIKLHGIAHIGGGDNRHMYSRTLHVYPDSVVWEADWKHY